MRVPMLRELERPEEDRVLGVDGVCVYVVGVRPVDERDVEGRVTLVGVRGLGCVDMRGVETDGRRLTTTRLRVELLLNPLDREGNDDFGMDRLVLGAVLRVGVRVEKLRVDGADRLRLNVLDRGVTERLGIDGRRENELLLRDGIDGRRENELLLRDGIEGRGLRGIDRLGIDRLGADRVTDLLGTLARLLEDLLRDDPPSAANASNRTAALAIATTARLGLRPSFTRNITNLLSPAVILSGNPGFPFPHYRRHRIRHLRSCGSRPSSYLQGTVRCHKIRFQRSLRFQAGRSGQLGRLALRGLIPSRT
jgi:hypothetical protein